MRSLGDALGRLVGKRQRGTWGDDMAHLTRRPPPSPEAALRMSQEWYAGEPGLDERRHAVRRRRGQSPWSLLSQLFIATAIAYGVVLGGHADPVIAYVSQHSSAAAAHAGFTISRVTIEGQERAEDNDLVKALGVGGGDWTLSFDTAAAQKRLEELSWVREAEVMRLLPSTLRVVIAERRPSARWQLNGKMYLIDRDGATIGAADPARDNTLPLVVGEGAAARFGSLFALLTRHTNLQARLRAAVRVADRRWTLKLEDGVDILLPEERIADALDWVAEADRTRALLSGALIAVDMRLGDRVTIRLSDEAAARRDTASTKPRASIGRDT